MAGKELGHGELGADGGLTTRRACSMRNAREMIIFKKKIERKLDLRSSQQLILSE